MNATRTTWPRSSERRTAAPVGSSSANSGAGAITFRRGWALIASDSGPSAVPGAGLARSSFSCAHAAGHSASVSASAKNRLTASSVEQHVVRTRGSGGRLREVDRKDGIELHPAVRADVDQAQRAASGTGSPLSVCRILRSFRSQMSIVLEKSFASHCGNGLMKVFCETQLDVIMRLNSGLITVSYGWSPVL